MAEIPARLIALAERKLGEGGVSVYLDFGEWVAERTTHAGTTRVAAQTQTILVWFLEQMPDRMKSDDD